MSFVPVAAVVVAVVVVVSAGVAVAVSVGVTVAAAAVVSVVVVSAAGQHLDSNARSLQQEIDAAGDRVIVEVVGSFQSYFVVAVVEM